MQRDPILGPVIVHFIQCVAPGRANLLDPTSRSHVASARSRFQFDQVRPSTASAAVQSNIKSSHRNYSELLHLFNYHKKLL